MGPLELFILLLYLLPAILVASYAARRGQNFWLFLLIGLVVSWVVSLIVTLVTEDKRTSGAATQEPASDHLDRLKTLTELRDSGTLSPEEFETEKARILAERG